MNWKKISGAAVLTGALLVAVVGCGQAATTGSATTTAPAASQPAAASDTRAPAENDGASAPGPRPSSGNFSGEMPALPSGNFTGERPIAPAIDLSAAAAQLGITEADLSAALGEFPQGILDLATAAQTLGISEDTLRAALGFSDNMTMPLPGDGNAPGGPPPDAPVTAAS